MALVRRTKRSPPLANVALTLAEVCREFKETESFVMDLWPSYAPMIVTFSPAAAAIVSTRANFPKPDLFYHSVKPLIGGPSILTMNGKEWKTWRSRFNPGFSATSLVDHVPFIVDCVNIFCEKLR